MKVYDILVYVSYTEFNTMICMKTGFLIYVESENKHAYVDLFFDGKDLYVNHNVYIDGPTDFPDGTCTSLEVGGKYDLMVNPIIDNRVIDYVCNCPLAGTIEAKFKELYAK